MDAELLFEPSCDMVGNTIYCSIETNVENAEFAFYVNIDGERKATFWYTDMPSVEYICGEQIVNIYEIVFFIRINGEEIVSKSITKKTNWSICDGVIEAVRNLVDEKSTILEFGSGMGSKILAEICTVYSIEHDERFLHIHESVNYIHAPLKEIELLSDFNESKWYDVEKIKEGLPDKIDLILVDGPPEKYGRLGLLHHLEMFDKNYIWIIDDVLREKDQKLANYISFKFDYIQYRFWNFSILSKSPLPNNVIETIHNSATYSKYSMSKNYINLYYHIT
jgi:hypothetical protein